MKNIQDKWVVFVVIYLVSNVIVSILLLSLSVSNTQNLREAERQRAAAIKQRNETLCILKILPQDRTPEKLDACAK